MTEENTNEAENETTPSLAENTERSGLTGGSGLDEGNGPTGGSGPNEGNGPVDPDRESGARAPETPLPPAIIDEAERLTKQARNTVDENEQEAYRNARDRQLADHDYQARIRDDERAVLVLYPEEWVEEGTIRPEHIENIDRGIERPLEGVGDGSWEAIESHNSEIVDAVNREYGSDHGANVRALADYAGNHYLKPIEELTGEELSRFLDDYYPRNAWPSDEQRAQVETSIEYAFEMGEEVVMPAWDA